MQVDDLLKRCPGIRGYVESRQFGHVVPMSFGQRRIAHDADDRNVFLWTLKNRHRNGLGYVRISVLSSGRTLKSFMLSITWCPIFKGAGHAFMSGSSITPSNRLLLFSTIISLHLTRNVFCIFIASLRHICKQAQWTHK